MRSAADALLSTLSRDQLSRALFPFDDEEERHDWDFIPKYRRNGLALRDMTDRQQVLAQQLLASALSLPAYTRAVSIMAFENVLREPRFSPQPEEGVTYAEKITAADRELDLSDPEAAVRVVRALSPHIGARTRLADRDVIVWRARVEDGEFVPVEVQPAGKRRMAYDEFLRGVR